MKKPFLILLTFAVYFVTNVAVALLWGGNEDIGSIISSALVSDVIWHILFYFFLNRFGEKAKDNAEK